MTCRNIEELIPAYLENDLPAPDREAVERHLASCAACRLILAEFESLEGALAGLAGTVPSWSRAQARFDRRYGRERRYAPLRVLLAPPALAGVALAAAGAALISRGREITAALEPFGAMAAARSAAFGDAAARFLDALAEMDPVLLSAIYGLSALAVMLGNIRFAVRWGKR